MTSKRLIKILASCLALAFVAVQVEGIAPPYDMVWRTGRATYYGGPTDAWSIHAGKVEDRQPLLILRSDLRQTMDLDHWDPVALSASDTPPDVMPGACNFGYLYSSDPLGWNVAAMNDGNPLYEDSCGSVRTCVLDQDHGNDCNDIL